MYSRSRSRRREQDHLEQQRINECRLKVIYAEATRTIKTRDTAITPRARRQHLPTSQEYQEEQRIRQPPADEQRLSYEQRRYELEQRQQRLRYQREQRREADLDRRYRDYDARDARLQAMRDRYPRYTAEEVREARDAVPLPTDTERFEDMAAYIRRFNNGSDDDL